MSNKIKAVIFDMDGVLIEAKDWHYEALNQALGLFGLEITRHEHLTTYDGLPTKDKLIMLSRDKGLSPALHDFINEMKQQYTMDMVYKFCKPMFHHEFALSHLKQEGYKLAVASNSIKNSISVMMDKARLADYLEFFISNQDVSKGKPDPEMYNLAITKLGLTPAECVIVEDNENGIRAAKASGAHVLEVATVYDVNYQNIKQFINTVESRG
ncbi:TPA: HAD family hydrolase [Escherichia coli]|uniref:HAD family hydrolase n=1 Tax=Escherichia coli TaxID=562 RepID=UPI0022501123|nr:HAD family phosphatase [Escherichia coli]EHZ0010076.1 HAD family phosphatase [Escherichia coli]EII2309508.1 HAD family phosphatase [Escherichia coli]MCX3807989.1 HAD family phosphatase [Escherichia coli]HAP6013844.1 HAD family phosphatase [Escherichia coli]HAV7602169.1 HAD family phosphatase [Escherichia coli]